MSSRTFISVPLLIAAVLSAPATSRAERTISADTLLDKLRGMWFGELIANHTGRPVEGFYTTREAAPDEVFQWVIKTSSADPWTGDDDTNFEYLNLHCMETFGIAPTPAQRQSEWLEHVTYNGIYIANLQARLLIDHGYLTPATGAWRNNMHAYAIDSQITTESLGAMSPGMRQWAIDAARRFGGNSNEGFSLHAAQFYAAMYAAAAFETDVHTIVALGQQSIPQSSRTWETIQRVRDWYAQDMLDSVPDWRETRRLIFDYYHGSLSNGRYRNWIESTINVANTTLALLYGEGDFEQTVRIGVLAGYDADCNPASAAGIIGMMRGYSGLPAALTSSATDSYLLLYFQGLPPDLTISGIATRMRSITGQVIIANGGSFTAGIYHLPDADPVTPDPELVDPSGPAGLVQTVQLAGGTVTTSASVEWHVPALDRYHLDSIIDGITDLRYDGHVPYTTCYGTNPNPENGDYYQLTFSEFVRFDTLTFHEGDLLWNAINADPRTNPPYGGYFETLTVEVHTPQGWTAAQGLQLSEPLDPFAYYQVIGMTFQPILGEAIRILGQAGGTNHCTTIVELEVSGARLGDFDGDGSISSADVDAFVAVLLGISVDPTAVLTADMNHDGTANAADIAPFIQRFLLS
jgi:hypothetical protein